MFFAIRCDLLQIYDVYFGETNGCQGIMKCVVSFSPGRSISSSVSRHPAKKAGVFGVARDERLPALLRAVRRENGS